MGVLEGDVSVRIDPSLYCETPDCRRPKETGRSYCTPCIRLARAVGRHLDDEDGCPAASLQVCAGSITAETLDSWPVLSEYEMDRLDDLRLDAQRDAELEDES